MWVRTLETADFIQSAAESFNKINPDIMVEIKRLAPRQYEPSLFSAATSGNLPDIFQADSSISPTQLRQKGLIQPLPIAQEELARYERHTWQEGRTLFDGKPYVWPDRSYRSGFVVMFYNKKLLNRGELDPDSPPATWEELITQAEKLKPYTRERNGAPIQLALKEPWFVERLTGQLGTTIDQSAIVLEPYKGFIDWKTGSVFVKEPIVQTVDQLSRLQDMNLIPSDSLIIDQLTAASRFVSGESAFLFAGHWFVGDFVRREPELSFGVAPLPSISGGSPYYGVLGGAPDGYMIASTNKHLLETRLWLQFLEEHYYPQLIRSSTAWSPIPEINRKLEPYISEPFRQMTQILQLTVRRQPDPEARNPAESLTAQARAIQKENRDIGTIVQESVAGDIADPAQSINAYGEELQYHFEKAVRTSEGASMENWIFPDWDIRYDYES